MTRSSPSVSTGPRLISTGNSLPSLRLPRSSRLEPIGRIRGDGQFDVVWTSEKPIRPVPYPIYRSREQWTVFLDGLYRGWGGAWGGRG